MSDGDSKAGSRRAIRESGAGRDRYGLVVDSVGPAGDHGTYQM